MIGAGLGNRFGFGLFDEGGVVKAGGDRGGFFLSSLGGFGETPAFSVEIYNAPQGHSVKQTIHGYLQRSGDINVNSLNQAR